MHNYVTHAWYRLFKFLTKNPALDGLKSNQNVLECATSNLFMKTCYTIWNKELKLEVLQSPSTSVGLRRDHYNALYRELNPKQPCGVMLPHACGILTGRRESTLSWKLSSPETISAHLNHISSEYNSNTLMLSVTNTVTMQHPQPDTGSTVGEKLKIRKHDIPGWRWLFFLDWIKNFIGLLEVSLTR